ncbi:neuronatin isoform X4 [Zalophus californianus]|uniref:Neuronatin n=2 Tax=Otariidae TaxID=9702 RepID=A0A3Q7PQI3_CALUR|nr:neuronatin isoform X2 [Callorhinus ursinus]XP_025732272.1 neuronatin isoform X2 [Callorhinus ursinus]XP_027478164.1 neuronatin isoform X4 [Zalophus californianus]
MRTWLAGGYLRRGHRGCGSAPNSGLREIGGPCRTTHALNHSPTTLGTMAAVAAASAELLIIGWYIFRVLLQVFRYSLQKLAYTVSRTGRQVLGERRQRAPN